MAKKRSRRGSTETFSVSVDAPTKVALRALADREFGGNMSALIADFAKEALRRKAAGDYARRHGLGKLSDAEARALEAEIGREVATSKTARRTKVA